MPTRWFLALLAGVLLITGFKIARSPAPGDCPCSPYASRADAAAGESRSQSPRGGWRFVDLTGQRAPDFHLADLHGGYHTLHEQRGRVVMLIFWASWCKTCALELPRLSVIARAVAPRGLVTLSINGEKAPDPVEEQARSLSFSVLRDPDEQTRRDYDAFSVPRVLIIDRSGRIARVIRGYGGDVTPVIQALAEQGLPVPASAWRMPSNPAESIPSGKSR